MVQLGVKPEKMEKVFLKWFKQALDNDDKLKLLNNSTLKLYHMFAYRYIDASKIFLYFFLGCYDLNLN